EPVRRLDVAVDRVRHLLRRILAEMMVLAGHRAEPAHLPEEPLQHLGAAAEIARDEAAGLLGEIEKYGARFEERDRRTAIRRRVIDDRRNAVVGRDFQELRLELVTGTDVDGEDAVGEAGLLEEYRDLVAVGRRPIMEIDHVFPFSGCGRGWPRSASAERTMPSRSTGSGRARAATRRPSSTPRKSRAPSSGSICDGIE